MPHEAPPPMRSGLRLRPGSSARAARPLSSPRLLCPCGSGPRLRLCVSACAPLPLRLRPCGPALVSGATASRRRMIMWLRPSCLPSRWREVARSAGGWSRRPRCRRVAADPSAVAVETEPAFDPPSLPHRPLSRRGPEGPMTLCSGDSDRGPSEPGAMFEIPVPASSVRPARSSEPPLPPWWGVAISAPAGRHPPRQDGIRPGRTARTDICPGVTNPGEQWFLPGFLTLSHPQRHIFRR